MKHQSTTEKLETIKKQVSMVKIIGIWLLGLGIVGVSLEQKSIIGLFGAWLGLLGPYFITGKMYGIKGFSFKRLFVYFLLGFFGMMSRSKDLTNIDTGVTQDGNSSSINQENLAKDQEYNPKKYIEVIKNDREIGGFGTVAEHTITLKNNSKVNYKDIILKATYYSKSDTKLGEVKKTIYDILPAGEIKTFDKINFGFINTQTDTSTIEVINADVKYN